MWYRFLYSVGLCFFGTNILDYSMDLFKEEERFSWLWIWSVYLLIWFITGGYYTLYLLYHTLGRDLR